MIKKVNLTKLYEEWNKKLRDSGFIDIEKVIGKERVLIQHASNSYRQADKLSRESKSEYYSLISEHLNKTFFDNNIDEKVMRLLSEGYKISEIVKKINTNGMYIHRQTVRFIIRRYENKWNIKRWNAKQMNRKVVIR